VPTGPPGKISYSRWTPKRKMEEGFSLGILGQGIALALLLAVLLSFLASTVVYFTNLDERILFWAVNIGSFLVIGMSSFLTARRAGSHGLLYGIGTGAGYAVVTLIIGILAFPPFLGTGTFLKRLGFAVLTGAAGGILGVNT